MKAWRDQYGIFNVQHRVFARWFMHLEFKFNDTLSLDITRWPSSADLLGGQLAEEAEEFLREEDHGP